MGITGTGLETGNEYRFINPGGVTQNLLANGMFTDNNGATQLLISEGNSPNAILSFVAKATLDEDGEPGLVFEIATFGCTPEVETAQTRPEPTSSTAEPVLFTASPAPEHTSSTASPVLSTVSQAPEPTSSTSEPAPEPTSSID